MCRFFALLVVSLALTLPASSQAAFHLFEITEVYSNADGSVQFVELFTDRNNQDELEGHSIDSNSSSYVFPMDLGAENPGDPGDNATADQYFLIATPDFEFEPGAVIPDYTLPAANFLDLVADTLDFGPGADTLSYLSGELPTDGTDSLHEDFGGGNRRVEMNSPTNFAGEVGALPEPGSLALQATGACAVFALQRRRRSKAVVRRRPLRPPDTVAP